jgi:hypothetical protein
MLSNVFDSRIASQVAKSAISYAKANKPTFSAR